ncbi:MAG: hypothetical protein LBQ66_05610 [Planctomycetaceae bacterium]|nr:hypothetical protein [Planctomycetaceae bacterium]
MRLWTVNFLLAKLTSQLDNNPNKTAANSKTNRLHQLRYKFKKRKNERGFYTIFHITQGRGVHLVTQHEFFREIRNKQNKLNKRNF